MPAPPAPHQEVLRFLKWATAPIPAQGCMSCWTNYGTDKHPKLRKWLAKPDNQRITLHITPAGYSWLNMAGTFFGIISRQAIRRGTFTSVKDFSTAIGRFTGACNDRCQLFTWTKDADELPDKIKPSRTNVTRH